ncbi:MAG: hypothetical protein IT371_09580 [Deltaproteobacteria bacterium]|nr:hypothetical protein [Deltaproteobacteria bacterium]
MRVSRSVSFIAVCLLAGMASTLAACGDEGGDPNPGSIESCASQVRTADPSVDNREALALCRSYVAKGGVVGERSTQGFNPLAWLGWLGIGAPKISDTFPHPWTNHVATCTVSFRDTNRNGCADVEELVTTDLVCPKSDCDWDTGVRTDFDASAACEQESARRHPCPKKK